MTIEEFWESIASMVESIPYCCRFCPVDDYMATPGFMPVCHKGCAAGLQHLYDELCKGKVKVGDEIYE